MVREGAGPSVLLGAGAGGRGEGFWGSRVGPASQHPLPPPAAGGLGLALGAFQERLLLW